MNRVTLTYIVYSFTFNSKVSNIVGDYLFHKETVMCRLNEKKEPENIVGTKKSKEALNVINLQSI